MFLKCLIRKLRFDNNEMTQQALSDLTNITISLISAYENNSRYPNLHTMWKLAKALNCTISDLYIEEENK